MTFWRFGISGLALFLALAALDGVCTAQVVFQPSGVATWNDDGNWSSFRPEGQYNETAVISTGGVAFVDTVFNDSTSPRGPGGVNIITGGLEIRSGGELTLGQPAADPISVNRSVTVGDTLTIAANGVLNAASIAFQSGATFNIDFTPATTSPVNVEGLATLGGTINLDYTGVVDTASPRTLITGGSFSGSFAAVNSIGLGPMEGVRVSRNGSLLQATVLDLLTLSVDRESGEVVLNNPHAQPVSLDGYAIRSAGGNLNPAALTGLGAGWSSSAANSPQAVTQLYEGTLGSPSTTIGAGASLPLSASGLFVGTPTAFLQDAEDLVLEYTDPMGTVSGIVSYSGEKAFENNLVLTIDATGQAAMHNDSPFSQEIEAYRIVSSDNPLLTGSWISLADNNVDNGSWSESGQSDSGMLLELQEDGTTTFNSTTLYSLGKILNAGFSETGLTFEYLLAGKSKLTQGVVKFDDLPVLAQLPGDFNDDGVVDAADYTVWRDNQSGETALPNDGGLGVPVSAAHYTLWAQNYGETDASLAQATGFAAPEPTAAVLGCLASCVMILKRRARAV